MSERKDLIRKYKETPPPMGVFFIRNARTHRTYIGTAKNLQGMLNRMRFTLDYGNHPVKELQKDWDESGPDAFEFGVLDTIEPPEDDPGYKPSDDLKELEQMWRDRLKAQGVAGYEW